MRDNFKNAISEVLMIIAFIGTLMLKIEEDREKEDTR